MKIKSSDILFRAAELMATNNYAGMCSAIDAARNRIAQAKGIDQYHPSIPRGLTYYPDAYEALYWGCHLRSRGPVDGADARRARSLHLLFLSHLARDAGD